MIKLRDINGHSHYVAPAAIARISEAGSSSQWHGIMAYVKLFDGTTIEARQFAQDIRLVVDKALLEQGGN